eukprot:363771-Chlamydomonas_euryale.AAC.16
MPHLEVCDVDVGVAAVLARLTVVELERVLVGNPRELGHARHDAAVEVADAVVEEAALLLVEARQDLVVITHHHEDVVAQHAVLVALRVDLHCDVRDGHAQPLPVVHLGRHRQQVTVEVHRE